MEPKALAVLAGLTPPGHEVAAVDDRFEPLPLDERWDLVALTVGTWEAKRAWEIAAAFRARGATVVAGGYHPSLCPEEAAEHVDAVAVGDAEGCWPAIVEDARAGRLRPVYRAAPGAPSARPDAAVLRRKGYAPVTVVQYGRGCRHACDFCCVRALHPRGLEHRLVDDVVEEVAAGGRRRVFFCDDNLAADPGRARALLGAIGPLGLRWTTQASLDLADDRPLLSAFARAGCQALVVGLESLDDANLRQMEKGWSRAEDYAAKLAAIRDHGIMVYAGFVFGYDGDRPDAFARALEFALEQRLFIANFNQLQPYPGTPLFERVRLTTPVQGQITKVMTTGSTARCACSAVVYPRAERSAFLGVSAA
jgi:radical SAM superfamily enzyme YgiQ (UPF0313 family)